jgi:hypothetical protein
MIGNMSRMSGRIAVNAVVLTLLGAAPALAQVDFSGQWAPLYHENAVERLPGPELGDYTEVPINDEARLRADSWDADRISVVEEYQCRPHTGHYALRGLGPMRIWSVYDDSQRITAFRMHWGAYENQRTIYLDGRPHPPDYAAHTFQGFSTGEWEGNMLTITSTHFKPGYMRRNGIPSSSRVTLTEHWVRHGDYLTITAVVDDPVFFTEPWVRSQNWYLDPGQRVGNFPCEYLPEVPSGAGTVPHHLPGTNPFLREYTDWYGVPFEAVRGGAETLYPEYRSRLGGYQRPPRCERYCNCLTIFECPLVEPEP